MKPVRRIVAGTSGATTFWFFRGLHHRLDGPAVIHHNGSVEYWQYGKLHRTDGPAIVPWAGRPSWWFRGVEYASEFEHQIAVKGSKK